MGAAKLDIIRFLAVYLLLLAVLTVMKRCKISQTKLLFVASMRMTVQLVIAGLILTYIFENPHPLFTVLYITCMTAFAIHRVIGKNKQLNRRFKAAIGLSLGLVGVMMVTFFVTVIVGESFFNPQYTIPLGGMIIGNAMTGVNLAVKSFYQNLSGQRDRINALSAIGAEPKKILRPFVNGATETAILPTLNSMLGMGIVSLPGMMTGQMLSGTLPTTAILYQIAIMITICTTVCFAVFLSLYFGQRSLYNDRMQIMYEEI